MGVSSQTIERAWAPLTVKAVQEGESRIISGVASTPSVDRVGDGLRVTGRAAVHVGDARAFQRATTPGIARALVVEKR